MGTTKKNRLYKSNNKPQRVRRKKILALLSFFVLPSLFVYGVITLVTSLPSSPGNEQPKIANANQPESDPETILIYK